MRENKERNEEKRKCPMSKIHTRSPSWMEKLPAKIIADILSRLPIESLAQAKYVSKLWNSIVNTPSFAAKHLSRNNRTTLILNYNNCGLGMSTKKDEDPFSVLFLLDPNDSRPCLIPLHSDICCSNLKYTTAGSVNGILCLVGPSLNGFPIYLCNPILNEYLTVPSNTQWPRKSGIQCATGFAFDPSTRDYKIVIYFNLYKENAIGGIEAVPVFEICTIRADDAGFVFGSWRSVGLPPYHLVTYNSNGCLVNGKLHWLANCNSKPRVIVSFDVHSEKFDLVLAPTLNRGSSTDSLTIGVLGGCLYLFDNWLEGCLDFWVMEHGKKKSWVKKYQIRVGSYKGGEILSFSQPLCFLDNGQILITSGLDEFYSFEPKSKILHDYTVEWSHYENCGVFNTGGMVQYTCNIVSLKGVEAS